MNLEMLLVYAVVGAAAAYVAWNLWSSFSGRGTCNCGKAHCAKHEGDGC